MPSRSNWRHLVLISLCCLLPLIALGAALFLNLSPALTALVALLLLIPASATLADHRIW